MGNAVEPGRGVRRRWRAFPGIWVLWILHSLGLVLAVDEPAGLLAGRPILDQDWGLHFHHLQAVDGYLASSGSLWGYSPYFMAGSVTNTHLDLSIKLYELAAVATPFLPTVTAFNAWVFLMASLVPWFLYGATRALTGDSESREAAGQIGALLGTLYWWSSLPREMFFYGMLGFPAGSAFAVLLVGILWRVLREPRLLAPIHAAWLLGCALILPLHVQAAFVAGLPGLCLLVARPTKRGWTWCAGGVLLAFLINAFWLVPAWERAGDLVPVLEPPIFRSLDPWTFLKDYATAQGFWTFREPALEKPLRIALLILGGLGISRRIRGGRRATGAALGLACLALFLLTYFGSFHQILGTWQPLRFQVPLNFFLAVPAAWALTERAQSPQGRRFGFAAGLGVLAFLTSAWNVVSTESSGRLTLRTRVPEHARALAESLEQLPPSAGRILFEESGDRTGFVHGGMYLSSFLPYWTGHQLIGGPINVLADRHHHSSFASGKLFQRDASLWTRGELLRLLDVYNVQAIAAFHPASLAAFGKIGDRLELLARVGPVRVFRVRAPSRSWFLRGTGRVEAGYDRVAFSEVQGPEVVLKFHWVEGLRMHPPGKLGPVPVAGDPIPFVRIRNPPASFVLSMHGGS